MDLALIVGGSLLVAAVVILVLRRGTQRLRTRGRAEIDTRYRSSEVLLAETLVQSFGQASKGVTQLRGSGALALTRSELCFVMYVPTSELRIPIASVEAVSLVKRHLGKTQGVDLLHVRYTREGVEDSIAWRLPEPARWKERIDSLRE